MSLGRCLQSILPAIIVVVVLRNGECGPWLCLGAISGIVSHVLIGVLAYPDYVGVEGKMRMSGFLTPNAFGFCSGITAVSGIALLSTGKWRIKGLVLAGLGVWGIKEGVARTAVLGVVISIIVVALVKRKDLAARSKRAAFIFRVGLGPVALGTLWTVVGNWDSLTKWFTTGNRATGSLTGRTEFWPNLLRGVASHPFFGFGPGALKVDGRLFGDDAFSRISQAHNSFVESLVAGGIPAGVFWVLLMISVYVQACRSMSEYRPIAIGVTAYLCVSSFTLGNMAGFGMGWFMLAGLVGWRVPMDAGVFRSSNRLVVDDIRGMSRGKLSNLRLGIGSVNSLS